MWQPSQAVPNTHKLSPEPSPHTAGGLVVEQATLGSSMVVKGELSGAEPLYIDGRVEGSIRFPNHRVTIGRSARVVAGIEAKEVVIIGMVEGNIECGDRLDIRSDATFTGDVTARRISIGDGALVKGRVEVRHPEHGEQMAAGQALVRPMESKPVGAAEFPAPEKAKAQAAAAPSAAAVRVPGSRVLYEDPTHGK
jgi:cytoskeletal protein CcmA (bactofilin family)